MATTYDYDLDAVDQAVLTQEILASGIANVTTELELVEDTGEAYPGLNLHVTFTNALSAGDKTILDNTVAAHPQLPPDPEEGDSVVVGPDGTVDETVLPVATETVKGIIEIATQAEVDAGTDDTRAITPSKLASYPGLAGNDIAVEDEGTPLTAAVTKFNFAGAGVTATEPVADEILVTIPGAGAPTDHVQVIYVGKHGDNGNDGKTVEKAVLTFVQALTLASALTPSTSNRIGIVCLDGGTYSENVSIPSYVHLFAANATLAGSITVADDSSCDFECVDVTSGTAIAKTAGSGKAFVVVKNLFTDGADGINNSSSGILNVEIEQYTQTGGVGLQGTSGIAHADIQDWDLYGVSPVAVKTTAGTLNLRAANLADRGGSGTSIGLDCNGGTTNALVVSLTTDTCYEVETGSTLNLIVAKCSGSMVDNGGTINVTAADHTHTLSEVIGGGSPTEIQDEGTSLTTDATKINFVGAGVTVTEPVADEVEVNIPSPVAMDLPTVVVRDSVGNASTPTTWTDLAFDQTDLESDASVVEHDNTNTDRIQVKETGLHLISWAFECDDEIQVRVRVNDTTVVNGSTQQAGDPGDINDVHVINAKTLAVSLTANDYLTVQTQAATTSEALIAGGTFMVTRLRGAKGDQGPTGAGSSVNLEDEGTTVTGGPHDTLNFVGDLVSVADAGSGEATVTISSPSPATFGTEYQSATDLTEKIETGDAYAQASRFTNTSVPSGTYMFGVWFDGKSASAGKDCCIRVQLDDTTTFWEQTIAPDGYVNFNMEFEVTLNGVHNFDVDFKRVAVGGDAYVKNLHYRLWRLS